MAPYPEHGHVLCSCGAVLSRCDCRDGGPLFRTDERACPDCLAAAQPATQEAAPAATHDPSTLEQPPVDAPTQESEGSS